jgi:hypothetical protein
MLIFNAICALILWNMSKAYFEEGMNFLGWASLFFSALNAAAFFANVL